MTDEMTMQMPVMPAYGAGNQNGVLDLAETGHGFCCFLYFLEIMVGVMGIMV